MDAERELVDSLLLHPDVVDSDLGVGYTTAVARFRVGFTLDLAVASRWSCNKHESYTFNRSNQSQGVPDEHIFDSRIYD